MEKLILRPYDKESMRMAMLKHEETFKEQVCELHRLYRIQKTLMKSIESRSRHHGNMHDHQMNSRMRVVDLERPPEEYNYNNIIHVAESDHHHQGSRTLEVNYIIDESEIELTLGPTRYVSRKKHVTPPLTSDSGPTFSSSSTESASHMNRTSSISKQHNTDISREQLVGSKGILRVNDMTLGYQSGSKNNIDLEEQLRQERLKQPPWLLQVLSMNMT